MKLYKFEGRDGETRLVEFRPDGLAPAQSKASNPPLVCGRCGLAASVICPECWEKFCDDHAYEHETQDGHTL